MFQTLIVDDEWWMCKALEKIVKQWCPGFDVSGLARDGEQALDFLQKDDCQLVLTDIRMPRMNGLDLLRAMRDRGLTIPVVMITGHSEFEYARTALRYGATDFILKPLDREEIKRTLLTIREDLANRQEMEEREHALGEAKFNHGEDVVAYMEQMVRTAYMKDLSLSVIAEETGFNVSYLSRLFKSQTGKGFLQYLTDVRLKEARRLLRETKAGVAEIAKHVGYWDVKHFSRQFKKHFGFSPANYRQRHDLGQK